MAFGKANPNEYLVVGENGKIVNYGTGVNVFLWPGTIWVVIPATKQEATFEMTQETKDGIPLHFKGIVVYRIIDPAAAAQSFNFTGRTGLTEISNLIRNICLGELRSTVSGMTMNECIEQRKTVLTVAVDKALRKVVQGEDSAVKSKWGIELEIVQVAQVFIVDADLRKQLESEIRNNIRVESDKSNIRSQEEIKLVQIASERRIQEQKIETEKTGVLAQEEIKLVQIASERRLQEQKVETEKKTVHAQEELKLVQIASERRIQEQKIETEKDAIRRKEEIDLAEMTYDRRIRKEVQEADRERIALDREKLLLELEAEKEKTEAEAPVRKLEVENRRALLAEELEMRRIENQVRQLEVASEVMLESAKQELRKEMLPIEQTPALAESLSGVFKGTQLSFVGNDSQVLALLAPLFANFSKIVNGSLNGKNTEI